MKNNRQLVCYWGSAAGLQLDGDQEEHAMAPRVVRFALRIARICCGEEHLLLLSADSRVYVMGSNSKHQLGRDDTELVYARPTLVPKLEHHNIVSLAAGWFHNVVISDEGEIYSWGNDEDSVLGYLPSKIDKGPRRASVLCDSATERIVTVYCGARHTILLSDQSTMYGFGDNEQHQLGLPQKKKYALPERIPCSEGITQVACGTSHTLALGARQGVFVTGLNNFGQLGTGNCETLSKFTEMAPGKRFTAVACGNHSAAISDDSQLYVWGTGPFGQYLVPTKITEQKIKRLWMGTTFGVAEGWAGELYSWGSNVSGQLGHGHCEPQTAIQKIEGLPIESIEDLVCGSHTVVAVGKATIDQHFKQYISASETHIEHVPSFLSNGKRNKGFEVLLSEQRHLQSNYKLEREHKKTLQHINDELRERITLLTQQLTTAKQNNRELLNECSNLKMSLEAARSKEELLADQIEQLRVENETQLRSLPESKERDLITTIKERQLEILVLRKDKVVIEEKLSSSLRNIDELTSANKLLNQTNTSLQAASQEALRELAECRNALQAATSKQSEGEKNVQEYILECYSLRAAATDKNRELDELQEAFELASNRVARLEQQNLELTKELSNTKLLEASMPVGNGLDEHSSWLHKASLDQMLRQNDIELHNYRKLLVMKDRQLNEMRKRFNCHQEVETATPTGSTIAQDSCRYSLRTVELLGESQSHLASFRQLLRDIHDELLPPGR